MTSILSLALCLCFSNCKNKIKNSTKDNNGNFIDTLLIDEVQGHYKNYLGSDIKESYDISNNHADSILNSSRNIITINKDTLMYNYAKDSVIFNPQVYIIKDAGADTILVKYLGFYRDTLEIDSCKYNGLCPFDTLNIYYDESVIEITVYSVELKQYAGYVSYKKETYYGFLDIDNYIIDNKNDADDTLNVWEYKLIYR